MKTLITIFVVIDALYIGQTSPAAAAGSVMAWFWILALVSDRKE